MEHDKQKMQGNKTHEQFLRNLERKDDMAKPGEPMPGAAAGTHPLNEDGARHSEFAVSRGGMNQESRDHNKHNHSGQDGHKPQKHSPAEEKH
jgi:hypothetical protein